MCHNHDFMRSFPFLFPGTLFVLPGVDHNKG
nr:MAG TPA_asm: hypothetical protein [Bacteriophage sp.]DAP05610.1 MAG TPA: hypothetical protein [Caudoviricetes sp.]